MPEEAFALTVRRPLPPIGEDALWWKECCAGGRAMIFTPFAFSFLLLFACYGVPFFSIQSGPQFRFYVLTFYYYAFVLFYGVGIAFRATAAVALERERQTLDLLLQIPDDPKVILRAKWYGALRKGWPWIGLIVLNVILGLVLGVYPPLLALWMLVAPWPLLLLISSVALLLSVTLGTVLRARLVLAILLLGIIFGVGRGSYNLIPGMPDAPFMWRIRPMNTPFEVVTAATSLYHFAHAFVWQCGFLAATALAGFAAFVAFAARGRRDGSALFRRQHQVAVAAQPAQPPGMAQ